MTGLAWMDREWSTSALGPELRGWDWFALQLSDGRELMYYRLRRRDGTASPFSAGTLVEPDGTPVRLAWDDVDLRVLDRWRSPRGGRYPSSWRITVPGRDLTLEVDPLVDDQEMDLTFRYWEGAVRVDGSGPSGPIRGRGYVELTGYDGSDGGRLGREP